MRTLPIPGGFGGAHVNVFFKRLRVRRPETLHSDEEGGVSFADLVRGYLRACPDDTLLEIGAQLGIELQPSDGLANLVNLGDSKYWLIDHFRVFISHVHTAKRSAGALRKALQLYGVSCFVAHDDIDVSDEWREEILRSLMSMDALVAILTPDFNGSKWTDQEVGVAVARGVLPVPISKGEHPYGFLAKYQALITPDGAMPTDVAADVFSVLSTNPLTKPKIIEALVRIISTGSTNPDTIFRIDTLGSIAGVGVEEWERVRENIAGNANLRNDPSLLRTLNRHLDRNGLQSLTSSPAPTKDDDEIPF